MYNLETLTTLEKTRIREKRTIQRQHWQHWVHKTQDKNKQNKNKSPLWQTISNNVNKTRVLPQTTGNKNDLNIVFMVKSSGHHNTEQRTKRHILVKQTKKNLKRRQ